MRAICIKKLKKLLESGLIQQRNIMVMLCLAKFIWKDYVPTYDECLYKFKKIPKAVLDIACIHKGQVYLGIEINHKHKVPDKKIELLKNLGLQELIEINASWANESN